MDAQSGRYKREIKTLVAMTRIYCKGNHKTSQTPCEVCKAFLAYAEGRLQRCPFGEEKEACSKCEIHCYSKEKREVTKIVMRYAGPKMLFRHPILSLYHLLDL